MRESPPDKESALTFGDLLKQHRLASGLTQEALAERSGMSLRGVAYLEQVLAEVSGKHLFDR